MPVRASSLVFNRPLILLRGLLLHLVLHLLFLQGHLLAVSGLLEVVVAFDDRSHMLVNLVYEFNSVAYLAVASDARSEADECDKPQYEREHPAGHIALSLRTDSVDGASPFALAGWDLAVSTICHRAQGHARVGPLDCGGRLSDEGKRGKKLTD